MPATWLDDPEHWWARREEARVIAEQLTEGYDRMAEKAQGKAAREHAPD